MTGQATSQADTSAKGASMSTMRKIGNVVRAPWDGLVAVLGGMRRRILTLRGVVLLLLLIIALLVTYYAVSSRHAPFTTDAFVQAYVVQVAARVNGQVVGVHVHENQRVARGQLLFEIDRRPFEHQVARLEARLALVVKQVAQLESQLQAARADHDKVIAEEAYAQAIHKQETAIYKEESTTERRYLDAVQKYKAAQAARAASQAAVRKVEEARAALVGDEHAIVAEARAELAEAKLNLEWTRVYAPADGYVTNVQLRAGSYATAGKPVLTCIDAREWWVVANLRENCLENVAAGQEVGLTFDTYPGRV